MTVEIWWVIKIASATYIAWRALLLLDVQNPLMGIMFAMVFSIGAPFGLDLLVDAYAGNGDSSEYWSLLNSVRIGMPMGFALLGVFTWSTIEGVTTR